jgi:choice-of-anchor B domain-containing protein
MKKNLLFIAFLMLCLGMNAQAPNVNIVKRAHVDFPGQTLANICGYAAKGKEYALLGASKGMIIMDVTNPDVPKQINQYPGPDNLWKEIKTYKNYAYVTSEGGQGLQIVDMSTLPDTTRKYKFYTGDGAIAGKLGKIHALHIDVKKGFVYCFGATGIAKGGAVIMDIATDPWNPKYVGMYDTDYIHDGYAENDTLYGCHIYGGYFSIIDMKDKTKFNVLNTQKTPTNFTHNAWLSDNHKYIFTTDENTGSYLGSYDISDPKDIKLLDKIRSNLSADAPGSIVHNTHILNDYAINSYYKDGITIVDCHKPDNLIEVGNFDTYTIGSGDGFEGCWGVYPFLPSGTIITSNIDEGFDVLTPTYKRACYLEGKVTDKDTKLPLLDVTVSINKTNYLTTTTDQKGLYKTGQANAATVDVVISKNGYFPYAGKAILESGKVTILDVELVAEGYLDGSVLNVANNKIVPNASILLTEIATGATYFQKSDAAGGFKIPGSFKGTYKLQAAGWSYKMLNINNLKIDNSKPFNIQLTPGFEDTYELDLGWTTEFTAANTTGKWVREVPVGTNFNGTPSNPGTDAATDAGFFCYTTGNGGGAAGDDDVDNGSVTLISPIADLKAFANPSVSYEKWFYNGGGNTPINDTLYVYAKIGTAKRVLLEKVLNTNGWVSSSIVLKSKLALTGPVQFIFETNDTPVAGHIVEAAIDNFKVTETIVATQELDATLKMDIMPSPFNVSATIKYDLQGANKATLKIFATNGQLIESYNINNAVGEIEIGRNLSNGTFIAQLFMDNTYSKGLKFVKQ